jgi:hypothetical protein
MAGQRDYTGLGEQAILELLAEEHAAVWHEVEAKIADQRWSTLPVPIDPHHLTQARHRLIARNLIDQTTQRTRGGRLIPVIVPHDQTNRTRVITDAAARKRLLQTRFLTWASGSASSGAGVIGPAGEHVVHQALVVSSPYGYRLINPERGDVRTLLGAPIPGGPLDNGAFLTTVDAQALSPTGQYVVVVEVKNVRSWIYPSTQELHQLLDKAARLQAAHPSRRFIPVLVCRRAHYLTNQMAEYLGFYVISTKRQYVPPALDGRELAEVRSELGYDLEPYPTDPPPALVKHFTTTLQAVVARTASRWKPSAIHLAHHFAALRDEHAQNRPEIIEELKADAEAIHGEPPRW